MTNEYYGKAGITDLQQLYLAFERINGKKLTKEPLYTVDTTPILEGLAEAIDNYNGEITLSEAEIETIKEHLQKNDGLFYYIDGLNTPIKIDNYSPIDTCNKLLFSLKKELQAYD